MNPSPPQMTAASSHSTALKPIGWDVARRCPNDLTDWQTPSSSCLRLCLREPSRQLGPVGAPSCSPSVCRERCAQVRVETQTAWSEDSLAEWCKVPAPTASQQVRGIEGHGCHTCVRRARRSDSLVRSLRDAITRAWPNRRMRRQLQATAQKSVSPNLAAAVRFHRITSAQLSGSTFCDVASKAWPRGAGRGIPIASPRWRRFGPHSCCCCWALNSGSNAYDLCGPRGALPM